MQVIGFGFEKILAERKKEPKGKVNVKYDLKIEDVAKDSVSVIKDQEVVRFSFIFKVNYGPDFAEISLKGFVVLILGKNKLKEILKHWKKKKVPDDVRLPLFNFILTKCNLKALQLEEEIGLPTHIPLPKLRPKEAGNANYAG